VSLDSHDLISYRLFKITSWLNAVILDPIYVLEYFPNRSTQWDMQYKAESVSSNLFNIWSFFLATRRRQAISKGHPKALVKAGRSSDWPRKMELCFDILQDSLSTPSMAISKHSAPSTKLRFAPNHHTTSMDCPFKFSSTRLGFLLPSAFHPPRRSVLKALSPLR